MGKVVARALLFLRPVIPQVCNSVYVVPTIHCFNGSARHGLGTLDLLLDEVRYLEMAYIARWYITLKDPSWDQGVAEQ